MLDLVDLGGPGASLSRVPSQSGLMPQRHRPIDERTEWGCSDSRSFRQHRLLDLRDQALVGEVDALEP